MVFRGGGVGLPGPVAIFRIVCGTVACVEAPGTCFCAPCPTMFPSCAATTGSAPGCSGAEKVVAKTLVVFGVVVV